jgi:prophage tail gpP-like protein
VDKSYDKNAKKSAGKIVKELANMAGVTVEKASDGITFPYYTLDSNKTAYDHMVDLAQLCGYDVYANAADKLVFTNYQKNPQPHLLEYGKNIMRILKVDQTKLIQSIRVTGESPGGGNEHWLTKTFKKPGIEGSGTAQTLLQSRVVRDGGMAKQVAQAVMNRMINQSFFVSAEIIGDPTIFLSDTVEIKGTPNGLLDGQYQVRTVEHFMSKSGGFITHITCRGDK